MKTPTGKKEKKTLKNEKENKRGKKTQHKNGS
jgi:hypothetical protein